MIHAPTITLRPDSDGIFRIIAEKHAGLEKLLFHRHPGREWGTFFRFGYRRTPWGIAFSFVDALAPEAGDLDRQSDIVEFRPAYIQRALKATGDEHLGIGVMHSHPFGFGVVPSRLDDDMDTYYGDLLLPYTGNAPYISLIVNRDRAGQFTFSGRVRDRGQWFSIHRWIRVGEQQSETFFAANNLAVADTNSSALSEESTTARWLPLIGPQAHDNLIHATVGVVGCSGTGSPAIEVLARAGVGKFVVVDYQRLSPSNLERIHGSLREHYERSPLPQKAQIAAGHIRAINPAVEVTAMVGNILDDRVLDELLRCNVVLNCTDTEHARVALGDFANHYLLSAFDVGVLMEGQAGKISGQVVEFTQYAPGQPCAYCNGRIQQKWLEFELMSETERASRRAAAHAAEQQGINGGQYWAGEPPQLNTVGYITTAAGAMLAGYVIGYLTGAFTMPHSRFQFDLGMPGLGVVAPHRQRQPQCSCGRSLGYSDQAAAERSISRPRHWPKPVLVAPAT